ncbi:hypothetical protein BDF22DRAFT_671880, partial [Syncephalis plumigaleata]
SPMGVLTALLMTAAAGLGVPMTVLALLTAVPGVTDRCIVTLLTPGLPPVGENKLTFAAAASAAVAAEVEGVPVRPFVLITAAAAAAVAAWNCDNCCCCACCC